MGPFQGVLNIIGAIVLWLFFTFLTFGLALIALAIWGFCVFGGADKRLVAAAEKVSHTLMPNEQLRVQAIQMRPFALFSRRKAIGMTESRIIVVTRGLFGGYTMQDIQWKDLQDAEICENVLPDLCGSSLSFAFRKGDFGSRANVQRGTTQNGSGLPSMVVGGLPSDDARQIYSVAQSEEQAWEEKRRVRAIEETRAAAGGVYLNTGPSGHESPSKASPSIADELNKLKALFDAGILSDAEFHEMKSKLISRV